MNRYERAGFERGRVAAEAGASLDQTPPLVEELATGTTIQHSERYMDSWRSGWAEGMGFDMSVPRDG